MHLLQWKVDCPTQTNCSKVIPSKKTNLQGISNIWLKTDDEENTPPLTAPELDAPHSHRRTPVQTLLLRKECTTVYIVLFCIVQDFKEIFNMEVLSSRIRKKTSSTTIITCFMYQCTVVAPSTVESTVGGPHILQCRNRPVSSGGKPPMVASSCISCNGKLIARQTNCSKVAPYEKTNHSTVSTSKSTNHKRPSLLHTLLCSKVRQFLRQ